METRFKDKHDLTTINKWVSDIKVIRIMYCVIIKMI